MPDYTYEKLAAEAGYLFVVSTRLAEARWQVPFLRLR